MIFVCPARHLERVTKSMAGLGPPTITSWADITYL